jgi:uncharacterized protein
MMKIGILSDTHSYFHPDLPAVLQGVDLILHAGDVGTPDILAELEKIAPLKAVWGNIDGQNVKHLTEEYLKIRIDDCKILMTHIGGHPKKWANGIYEMLMAETPDIFICGHSHILRIERVKQFYNMLYINPGACGTHGWHKHKTVVLLTIENGKATKADVVHL